MNKTGCGNPFPFLLLLPALAFCLFIFPLPLQADDILATSDISRITAIDSDGDGLTNVREAEIGTNPNLFDSDGDGYGDGIESANPGADAHPISPTRPGLGADKTLRDFTYIQNITEGSTRNALASTWLLDGRIAYIEADENFANGSIFVKDLYDMSKPRREVETGLSAELRELGADPLGNYVFYHKADPLSSGRTAVFSSNIHTGEVKRVIPSPSQGALPYNIKNPSVGAPLDVDIQNATLTIDADGVGLWAITETDLPNAEIGQLYGFKLSTDPSTYGEWTGLRRQVTNNQLFKNRYPLVSNDLESIMFVEHADRINVNSSGVLNEILSNISDPFFLDDTRLDYLSRFALPIGFSKNTWYFSYDALKKYSFSDPLNFSTSDFDMWIKGPPIVRIPLPGNQVLGSISPEGGRIMFMDDYLSDGVPGGNFNIYVTSLSSMTRIRDGIGNDIIEGFVTPGSVFSGNTQSQVLKVPVELGQYQAQQLFAYSPLKPVSDAVQASSAISSKVVYGPDGLYVVGGVDAQHPYTGFYQTFSWTPQELVVRNGDGTTSLMDETQITMGWGVVSGASVTYESVPEQYILERDIPNRRIRFIAPHFSEYGLIAPKILKQPSSVDHWQLQD